MPGQKPGGVIEVFGPEGQVEHDTSTCSHCQHVTVIPSRRRMMEVVDVCRVCMKLVCVDVVDHNGNIVHRGCAGKPCRVWEKEMERQEARGRLLRDMGLI